MWYSQTSSILLLELGPARPTLLSTHEPHGFPSRFVTVHLPRSAATPMTAIAEDDGGVRASIEDDVGFLVF